MNVSTQILEYLTAIWHGIWPRIKADYRAIFELRYPVELFAELCLKQLSMQSCEMLDFFFEAPGCVLNLHIFQIQIPKALLKCTDVTSLCMQRLTFDGGLLRDANRDGGWEGRERRNTNRLISQLYTYLKICNVRLFTEKNSNRCCVFWPVIGCWMLLKAEIVETTFGFPK